MPLFVFLLLVRCSNSDSQDTKKEFIKKPEVKIGETQKENTKAFCPFQTKSTSQFS